MKNLSNYIQNLNFEYAISYSGLRGEKFTNLEKDNKEKIQQIELEIESARFMQIPNLRKKIEMLKTEISPHMSLVINKNGELHKSAIEIHRFEKEDKDLKSIFAILNMKLEKQIVSACAPIFRDSIAFYSKEDQLVGILQICASCLRIKNENEETFDVDHSIFPLLIKELTRIGHPIETKFE